MATTIGRAPVPSIALRGVWTPWLVAMALIVGVTAVLFVARELTDEGRSDAEVLADEMTQAWTDADADVLGVVYAADARLVGFDDLADELSGIEEIVQSAQFVSDRGGVFARTGDAVETGEYISFPFELRAPGEVSEGVTILRLDEDGDIVLHVSTAMPAAEG